MRGKFQNPLLRLDAYRTSLMLAGAAACLMGIDPAPLSTFLPVEGRMTVRQYGDVTVVDNSNSGTNSASTLEAARYAREVSKIEDITLVIGQEQGDGAVCEGFSDSGILDALHAVNPCQIIIVGRACTGGPGSEIPDALKFTRVASLSEGLEAACRLTRKGSIVLAVKTWR
jgi:hypothetical protein